MLFNSIFFVLTLSPFLVLYYVSLRRNPGIAKLITLAYSYFFYGMWNPWFTFLLLFSTVLDYHAARMIESKPRFKGWFLTASLVGNLGLLGYFKYFGFLAQQASWLSRLLGVDWSPPLYDILLPVGISFYTFQTLSYTIDVYRGQLRARRSLVDVAVYVAFFPQLVAGPIVRARDLLPQLDTRPALAPRVVSRSITLIIAGLFLKCVIADQAAPRVNTLFDSWQSNGLAQNWSAAMLFGVQIYGDFAGYSLIALGLAGLMGYTLPANFNAPFAALGFSDFWRRWHITLSTWLRDYLYIPLGGNRRSQRRTYLNLMATMLLGGLWHGASVMFVLWGAIHGLYLCVERVIRGLLATQPRPRTNSWLLTLLGITATYVVVSATWIPFRARSAHQCLSMMAGLVQGPVKGHSGLSFDLTLIVVVLLWQIAWRGRDFVDFVEAKAWRKFGFMTIMLLSLFYASGARSEFIYFQF